ncbi:hypothetical protein ACS0TY_023064 [Phlomoides rotata]
MMIIWEFPIISIPTITDADQTEEESSDILQWLSRKKQNSTVHISFGSEYFMSKEEIEDIAKGVELSEANFIWVIRFPVMEKIMSIEEAHPQGFLDRGIEEYHAIILTLLSAKIYIQESTFSKAAVKFISIYPPT